MYLSYFIPPIWPFAYPANSPIIVVEFLHFTSLIDPPLFLSGIQKGHKAQERKELQAEGRKEHNITGSTVSYGSHIFYSRATRDFIC